MTAARTPTTHSALVVSAGLARAPVEALLHRVAETTAVQRRVVPNLSACLGEMARSTPDLIVFSRRAACDGQALVEVLSRCRPDFKGWLLIVDRARVEIFDCGLPGSPRWRLPFEALAEVTGWVVGDRWPGDSARA